MGKANKALTEFLDNIPDSKLTGISETPGTLWNDENFRLDLQGVSTVSYYILPKLIALLASLAYTRNHWLQMTSGTPKKFNLQVQINKQSPITSLKTLASGGKNTTVATVIAPVSPEMSATKLRDALKEARTM